MQLVAPPSQLGLDLHAPSVARSHGGQPYEETIPLVGKGWDGLLRYVVFLPMYGPPEGTKKSRLQATTRRVRNLHPSFQANRP